MKIYVAGEYSLGDIAGPHEREENTHKAIQAGIVLVKWGHDAYVPHFTHYMAENDYEPKLTYKDYMLLDKAWMEHCDAILVLSGSKTSTGVRTEIEWFRQRGRPIFTNLKDVPRDPYRALGLC